MNVTSLVDLFSTFGTVLLLISGLMVMAFGAGLWWAGRAKRNGASSRRTLPEEWPLISRNVTNYTERLVWQWLRETFPEYLVVPKLTITRFTSPTSRDEAKHWFDILGSIYCTFAVCNSRGSVIGCVDIVTGQHDLWRSNRQLKQSLLSQCGMAYWVVTPTALPERAAIRAEFLGEDEAALVTSKVSQRIVAADLGIDPNNQSDHFINPTPTAPVPLAATFQRAEEQLRETLTDRRRNRRQYSAANDDKETATKASATAFRNSELLGDDSFFMSFDGEQEDAIHSLLSKKG